ncbi:copper resistance CopC family protein [Nocardia carnea]|uniref:copper resistance CopC family protein n=1 Tax=Nocardia carnea TaxID=37328 RepID=UPI002458EC06|nr:copper resistance protein CopC [Nocardia carnea]
MNRRAVLFALVTALIGLLFGPVAGTAAAHSTVVSSDPADGAVLDTGPARATITFNEPLQPNFPAMTVVGPDGNLWSKGDPVVEGRDLSVEVGELGPTGVYRVAFRVTSADGHVVDGERTFTLSTAGHGTPGPAANAQGSGSGDGGVPVWVFIAGAVVLFGAGLAFALFGSGLGKGKNRQ